MHKKRPKICTGCRISAAKIYIYHSTKIAKARPGFDDRPKHPSIQINSSSPCLIGVATWQNIAKIIWQNSTACM